MYKIYADGSLIYDTERDDKSLNLISPQCNLEVNKSGSLDFTMPSGHPYYDNLELFKTVITVTRKGKAIFKGRIINKSVDSYLQMKYTCEGDLSFLLDSMLPPTEWEETVGDFFRRLINNHNTQVDDFKKLTIGTINATKASETSNFKTTGYTETRSLIDSEIIDIYGGYIRTRTEGNITYIDWIQSYNASSAQPLELGSNVVNFQQDFNVDDLFTVLVPTGDTVEGTVTDISSVNSGSVFIEDQALISKYGRIVHTKTFNDIDDPSELKSKAQEYFEDQKKNWTNSFTITAIDLHYIDETIDEFELGDMIHVVSKPHNVDTTMMCTSVKYDLQNPGNDSYTIGTDHQTLSEKNNTESKEAKAARDYLQQKDNWNKEYLTLNAKEIKFVQDRVDILGEEINIQGSQLRLKASYSDIDRLDEELGNQEHYINTLMLNMDAVNGRLELTATKQDVQAVDDHTVELGLIMDLMKAEIDLKAEKSETLQLTEAVNTLTERTRAAEIRLDAANAQIQLKASQTDVDTVKNGLIETAQEVERRITSAEILLDGVNATLDLKVSKGDLISQINMSTEGINIRADKLDMTQVKNVIMREFSSEYGDSEAFRVGNLECHGLTAEDVVETYDLMANYITNNGSGSIEFDGPVSMENLSVTGNLSVSNLNPTRIQAGTIRGTSVLAQSLAVSDGSSGSFTRATWKSLSVVTGLSTASNAVKDYNGNFQTFIYSVNPLRATIYYLGRSGTVDDE